MPRMKMVIVLLVAWLVTVIKKPILWQIRAKSRRLKIHYSIHLLLNSHIKAYNKVCFLRPFISLSGPTMSAKKILHRCPLLVVVKTMPAYSCWRVNLSLLSCL